MRRNLVIDVGMHDGTDTAFYLAKGFNVVAIEGDPALVAAAEKRFQTQIARGQLTLIGAAVAEAGGTISMAISDEMTIWSSIDTAFIERSAGANYRYLDVPAVQFEDVLSEHGVPYYLKVDIEGMDMLPVRALHTVSERPQYLSIESNVSSADARFERAFDELAELWSLGYRRFQYVNQRRVQEMTLAQEPMEGAYGLPEPGGHWSGPFGRELPGRWLTLRQALAVAELLRVKHNLGGYGGRWSTTKAGWAYARARRRLTSRGAAWYDLHACLGN